MAETLADLKKIGLDIYEGTAFAMSLKETVPFEKPAAEASRTLSKYPERAPVICEKAPRTNLPEIEKKFLVPPRAEGCVMNEEEEMCLPPAYMGEEAMMMAGMGCGAQEMAYDGEPCHRVYVRGFDFGTTEEALKEHFGQAGPVTSVELWGRGAAAVTFASAEAAQAALSLHRSTVPGNKRFVEVKLDDDPSAGKPGSKVLVRGFDFGTTDEQLQEHCSKAGTIASLQWVSKGSALLTYSTPAEAENAAKILNRTTIEGNKRFIDVMQKDDNFDPRRMMMGMPPMFWYANFARAYWGGGKGKGKGKSDKKEDPEGSGRVFVRGFDFGTTDEQLIGHMSAAGEVETVHWVSKGSAIVIYKQAECAAKAVETLQKSVIGSNTRYIDIVLKESE